MAVTDHELWVAIGVELAGIRRRSGHENTFTLHKALKIKDRGAPAKNTLDAVERGTASIEKVEAYAKAMGYSLVDLIGGVLASAGADERPLSADARWVARMFQDGPDEEARGGMLALARSQAAQLATGSAVSPTVTPVQQATSRETTGRARTARGRR